MNTTANSRLRTASSTKRLIETLLVSPGQHKPLTVVDNVIVEKESGLTWELREEVAIMIGEQKASYFDDKFEVMRRGHENAGEWNLCYSKQIELLEMAFKPAQVVLDVGCGPWLPYKVPVDSTIVGLEPSFHSLRANQQLDLRVMGSAQSIPMPDRSVDVVVCFYSIHHMVGNTIEATRANVVNSLKEFGRVLKRNGVIFIFEISPVALFDVVQRMCWPYLRRKAPDLLDMYFWRQGSFRHFFEICFPEGPQPEVVSFPISPFVVFSPAFSLPWLKVPRFMYPLSPFLYKWSNSD